MHSCKQLTAPSASPPSAQLNVVDIASAGFTSVQSAQYIADHNTDALVRVDLTSPVACTDACRHAPAIPASMGQVNVQAQMLACINNLQAKGQLRSCIPEGEEEEMQPACVYPHSHHAHMQRHHDQYSNAEEEVYNSRVQSCLPPMSSTLIECIESARARVTRYTHMWTMMQMMSTVSQIIGVLLVLGLCSKEEVGVRRSLNNEPIRAAPLRAWAVGYALGCLAWLPVLCKHSQWTATNIDLVNVEEHTTILTHELNTRSMVAGREVGTAEVAGAQAGQRWQWLRLRRSVDFFFGIWFVLGVVWVFGRPPCAQASPKLYSLCVTLLMLSGLRYMMPLILCCALCCFLQPTTSSISRGVDQYGGRKKGATQEQIDETLPILKFKHRRFMTNNVPNEIFPIATTSIVKQNICKDGMEYCCICLGRYKEEARLRRLPCSHYFYVDCVDKWLMINASCPLCKFSIKENKFCPSSLF